MLNISKADEDELLFLEGELHKNAGHSFTVIYVR